jgi:hypothetical protein
MSKQDDLSADHISWLVKSRSQNQEITLKLFLVMKDNEDELKNNWDLGNFAQALAGVCFSLWRAVFLSDIADEFEPNYTVSAAQSFLGNLILHNMVAYPQDRNTRDWSYLYYINNARYRLEFFSKKHNDILPASVVDGGDDLNAKDYWSYYHNACEIAVRNLERVLKKTSDRGSE